MRSFLIRIAVVCCAIAFAFPQFGDDITVYRSLQGEKKSDCYKKAITSPSQFRIDPDGLSTFEQGKEPGLEKKPYVIAFLVTGVPSHPKANDTGTVAGMAGYTATFTPDFGAGHWSLKNVSKDAPAMKQDFSEYAKINAQRNPAYLPPPPYCP